MRQGMPRPSWPAERSYVQIVENKPNGTAVR
jgi:hypothetical protein